MGTTTASHSIPEKQEKKQLSFTQWKYKVRKPGTDALEPFFIVGLEIHQSVAEKNQGIYCKNIAKSIP